MTFISNRTGQRSSVQPAPENSAGATALPMAGELETELNEIEIAFANCYQRFMGNVPSDPAVWRTPNHFYEDSCPVLQPELKPVLAIFLLGALGMLMVQVGRYLEAARQADQATESPADRAPSDPVKYRSQSGALPSAIAPPEVMFPEFSG